MTDLTCLVVPAAEMQDAMSMLFWLPILVLVVGWVLRYDWEWTYRRYARRMRLRAIREVRTHA